MNNAIYSIIYDKEEILRDLGLLIFRVTVGIMMAFSHGIHKISLLFSDVPIQFPDPIGLGPKVSIALAGGSEFFLSLFLVVGLFTRIVTLPLMFTMLVAILSVHLNDPFAKMELAVFYLISYLFLTLAGPGKYSFDFLLKKKFKN